jgi:hypothetical protein
VSNHAFVIGESGSGDFTVESFENTVLKLNYDLDDRCDYAKALRRLRARSAAQLNGEFDLVLFVVGPTAQNIPDHLEGLRAPNRQVIVYAHEKRASTRSAVEYCRSGLAHDYLVWGEKNSRVEQHVNSLYDRQCPYPKIGLTFGEAEGERGVFIATPYDNQNRIAMADAVDPALRAVGLRPRWADEVYRDSTIPEDVRRHIRESVVLIANIRQGPELAHNANVYYEAGQASALDKPVIFVRPLDEKDLPVPADISARRRIEYDNPIDLAMRLYHGLTR